MKRGLALAALLLASLGPVCAAAAETLAHGRFPKIALHAPTTPPVARFVLLLSDGDGWTTAMDRLAAAIADDGALVAGIDVAALEESLAEDECVNVVGDLENLAHFVQGYRQLPTYFTPVLAGVGSGAALAYATLAQAPDGLFAGLASLDFCATIALSAPLCAVGEQPIARGDPARQLLAPLPLAVPWRALTRSSSRCPGTDLASLRGTRDAQRRKVDEDGAPAALREAVRALAPPFASPPTAILEDLPLIEVPAATRGPRFAILLSGDGGWAGLDKDLATGLAAQGLPVVGFDSLRYFWSARTPAGLAADLDRLIRAYAARWHCTEVVLVGYSQGADVLPFAVNRLPRAARRLVAGLVLLGPGARASFEFHLESWLHRDDDGLPTAPELARLSAREVLCVYGRDDEDAICPRLPPARARLLALPGDHHFDGDYAALAARILAQLARLTGPAGPGRPSMSGDSAR